MKAPKQRTALLAATLAALVSGGVAFQAFAETPIGLRDSGLADYGTAALSGVVSGPQADTPALAARDTFDPGRFAAAGSLSQAVDALSAQVTTAEGPDFSRLLAAFESTNAALAAPDDRFAALRAGGGEGASFTDSAGLKAAVDLDQVIAAANANEGRLGFAGPLEAAPAGTALRAATADEAVFAGAAQTIDAGALTAALDLPAARAAFAAQTSGASIPHEALRSDREDASLFAGAVDSAQSGLEADLSSALAGYAIGGRLSSQTGSFTARQGALRADDSAAAAGFAAQTSELSGVRDALRAGGLGDDAGAAFAAAATAPTTLDLDTMVAALTAGSTEQDVFSGPALSSDSLRAALRAGDLGSGALANEATSSVESVDFAAIGAALSEEE